MRHDARPRRGYALVLLVVFMMVFLSIAGLVIGLGFTRLSQQQMQSATDAAALEGLRWRDEIPEEWTQSGHPQYDALVACCGEPPASSQTANDADWIAWRDCARRCLAAQMADRILSDPNGQVTTMGAGPKFVFQDGIALRDDFRASETISLPVERTYRPQLQPNNNDLLHGDMVAGTYGVNPGFSTTLAQDETSDYQRRDFVSDGGNDAFLVRMRRTRGGDLDDIEGISSHGSEVPLLFGRWMTFTSGLTVRSASIAAVGAVSGETYVPGLAKSVGPYDEVAGITGLAPFGLSWSFWQDFDQDSNPPSRWQDGSASLTTNNGDLDPLDGYFIDPQGGTLVVGDNIPSGPDDAILAGVDAELASYVPIYESLVIIGFAKIEWSYEGSTLTLTRPWNDVSSQPRSFVGNGVVSGGGNAPSHNVQTSVTDDQFAPTGPLYTPVLVNRHFGPN